MHDITTILLRLNNIPLYSTLPTLILKLDTNTTCNYIFITQVELEYIHPAASLIPIGEVDI